MLSLTGSASLSAYESALESITFSNNSDTPDVNTRTVTWLVNDGDSDSSAITSNVSVASVNDAPLISGVDVAISYTSGQSAQVIDSDLSISDADDTMLEGATVSITSSVDSKSEDSLSFDAPSGISGSYNSSTGVLSLSGSATIRKYKNALESVKYDNSSDSPKTGDRTVTWVVNDGSSNSASVTTTSVLLMQMHLF